MKFYVSNDMNTARIIAKLNINWMSYYSNMDDPSMTVRILSQYWTIKNMPLHVDILSVNYKSNEVNFSGYMEYNHLSSKKYYSVRFWRLSSNLIEYRIIDLDSNKSNICIVYNRDNSVYLDFSFDRKISTVFDSVITNLQHANDLMLELFDVIQKQFESYIYKLTNSSNEYLLLDYNRFYKNDVENLKVDMSQLSTINKIRIENKFNNMKKRVNFSYNWFYEPFEIKRKNNKNKNRNNIEYKDQNLNYNKGIKGIEGNHHNANLIVNYKQIISTQQEYNQEKEKEKDNYTLDGVYVEPKLKPNQTNSIQPHNSEDQNKYNNHFNNFFTDYEYNNNGYNNYNYNDNEGHYTDSNKFALNPTKSKSKTNTNLKTYIKSEKELQTILYTRTLSKEETDVLLQQPLNDTSVSRFLCTQIRSHNLNLYNSLYQSIRVPEQLVLYLSEKSYKYLFYQLIKMESEVQMYYYTELILVHLNYVLLYKYGCIIFKNIIEMFNLDQVYNVCLSLMENQVLLDKMLVDYEFIGIYRAIIDKDIVKWATNIDSAIVVEEIKFFVFVDRHLIQLYNDVICSELLMTIIKKVHTQYLVKLIESIFANFPVFLDNMKGVELLKSIVQLHIHENHRLYMRMVECICGQLGQLAVGQYCSFLLEYVLISDEGYLPEVDNCFYQQLLTHPEFFSSTIADKYGYIVLKKYRVYLYHDKLTALRDSYANCNNFYILKYLK